LLLVKKLDPNAKLPTVAHAGEDLAYDVYALEDTTLVLGRPTRVKTGIAACFEKNLRAIITNDDGTLSRRVWTPEVGAPFGLLVHDRSSMASKGLVTSGGVIDAGYRGEIQIIMTLVNDLEQRYDIEAGAKIAQLRPVEVHTARVFEVDELPPSSRGDAGFGSTGR
jgi:dUTP pyrophosphatase